MQGDEAAAPGSHGVSTLLRILHYGLMAFVLALAGTGFSIYFREPLGISGLKLTLVTLHAFIAYVFLCLLVARIALAFMAPQQAGVRFFLPRPKDLARFGPELAGALQGRKPRFAARSPISRVLSASLYLAFALMAATGLVRAGTDLYHPPIGPVVARYLAAEGVSPEALRPGSREGTDPHRYDRVMAAKVAVGKVHIYTGMFIVLVTLVHGTGAALLEWKGRTPGTRGPAGVMLLGQRRRGS